MAFKVTLALVLLLVSLSCGAKLKSALSGAGDLKPRSSPVQVGEVAPDFTLEDQNNQRVTLSSARGNTPTVLVFYRGNW
jgi:cytochrome oxidase Cu insertion factor (SCO1/SenC/PrrC family)